MKDSQVLPLIWWQEDMLDSPDEVILGKDGVQQASPISSTPVDQWKDTKNLMSLGQNRPTENFYEAKKINMR